MSEEQSMFLVCTGEPDSQDIGVFSSSDKALDFIAKMHQKYPDRESLYIEEAPFEPVDWTR
jgi:hypothetical protein